MGQLRALTRDEVAATLDAHRSPSDITDTAGIAELLGVSAPTAVRECEAGLPHFFVGSHRRFSRSAVLAYYAVRAAKGGA